MDDRSDDRIVPIRPNQKPHSPAYALGEKAGYAIFGSLICIAFLGLTVIPWALGIAQMWHVIFK